MSRLKKLLKIFKKAAIVLWWSLTVVLIVGIFGIMTAKMRGEVPYFFG